MATAPHAAAMAKAPPPEVFEMQAQEFAYLADFIADTPRASESDSAPQSQRGSGSSVLLARENSEPAHSAAQGNSQTPPATAKTHSTIITTT